MPRMSQSEVNAYLARSIKIVADAGGNIPVSKESELHRDILAHCKRMGWIAFHGSMAHQTFRTPGEPDFVILLDGGRFLMVECKTGAGKLSTDQLAIHAWADRLNHTIYTVRDFETFIQLTKTKS